MLSVVLTVIGPGVGLIYIYINPYQWGINTPLSMKKEIPFVKVAFPCLVFQ